MSRPKTHTYVDSFDHQHVRWLHVNVYPHTGPVLAVHEPRFRLFEAAEDIWAWIRGWRW